MATVRLDKWLWAARLFKTRGEATQACQAGKVKSLSAGQGRAGSRSVKPSRPVTVGSELTITRKLYRQRIRVEGLSERRSAAKLAATLYSDLTPPEELELVRAAATRESAFVRGRRQAGRPSKRERRVLQSLKGKF